MENGIFFLRPTRFTQRDAFVATSGPFSAPLAYTCIRLCRAHSQRDPFVVVLTPLCTTCRRKAKKRTLYLRSVVFNLRSKRPPLVFLPEKTGKPARKTKRKTASQKGQTVRAGGRSSFDSRFEVFLIFFLKERACRNSLSDVWASWTEKCGKGDFLPAIRTRHSTRLFRRENTHATCKLL